MFLGPIHEPAPGEPYRSPGLRTIAFTDIVGSTDRIGELGDIVAMESVLAHDELVREHVSECGGREVDHTGDGLMLAFDSVAAALTCSISVMRSVRALDPDDPLSFGLRVGMAAGEPVARDDRLFGAAVNLAARVCAVAAPGEILVAGSIRELAAGKGYVFADRGESELKGFGDSVRLFAVPWD